MSKYLNENGISYLWSKIKSLLSTKADANHTHNPATTSTYGFMSPNDVTKLENLSSGKINTSGNMGYLSGYERVGQITGNPTINIESKNALLFYVNNVLSKTITFVPFTSDTNTSSVKILKVYCSGGIVNLVGCRWANNDDPPEFEMGDELTFVVHFCKGEVVLHVAEHVKGGS